MNGFLISTENDMKSFNRTGDEISSETFAIGNERDEQVPRDPLFSNDHIVLTKIEDLLVCLQIFVSFHRLKIVEAYRYFCSVLILNAKFTFKLLTK